MFVCVYVLMYMGGKGRGSWGVEKRVCQGRSIKLTAIKCVLSRKAN
jgi:hypothetical protein